LIAVSIRPQTTAKLIAVTACPGGDALFLTPPASAAELAARTLAFPDAQSVEDLTVLTSAGER
jgi:hypothetical protein